MLNRAILSRYVPCVAHDGGGRVVCGGSDGSVMLFSLSTGSLLSTVEGAHRGSVLSVTWDSLRLLVVSGGADGSVVGWKPARGRPDALEAAEVRLDHFNGTKTLPLLSPARCSLGRRGGIEPLKTP